jgi:ABC-type nickel/cobalt efflux system permease component RcnA
MIKVAAAITALALSGWVVETAANNGWASTLLIIGLGAAAITAVIRTHRADQADHRARQDRRYASQHPVNRGRR